MKGNSGQESISSIARNLIFKCVLCSVFQNYTGHQIQKINVHKEMIEGKKRKIGKKYKTEKEGVAFKSN